LVDNAYILGILKMSWFFCEGPIKMVDCKKYILSFEMHPHLDIPTTNQCGLQVGIVIKVYSIIYIHLHAPKHLQNIV